MEAESLNLANTKSVTIKHPTDDVKRVIGLRPDRVFLQDTEKGAVVQVVAGENATIYRFRGVKADDLRIEAQLLDPNSPAGIYGPAQTATETEAAATK